MTGSADGDPWRFLELGCCAAGVLATAACAPFAAAFVWSGAIPSMSMAESLVGTVRIVIEGHWSTPSAAFPLRVRGGMPPAPMWWAMAAVCVASAAAAGALVWRRVDALVARSSPARRAYDVRGSRARTWARPRDLAGAVSRDREAGRFTLGRLDRRLVLSDDEAHVTLVAPTRSGKTTRYVIPWLLEHDGPAIVTSTKLDVVTAAGPLRARSGRVWIWDPFGPHSATWSPLRGCEHWSFALAQAQWLADASGGGDSEIAAYWRGEAAKLLAPLLHAAALSEASMTTLLGWVDTQVVKDARQVLTDADLPQICGQLDAVTKLDPRNRGTTFMSAGSVLAAYRYPELARAAPEFVVEEFLAGGHDTLFVVAGARHQRLLAPLVVGLLSSVLHAAAERSRRGSAPSATLRVLLDEAANIAPLRDLPAHLSQAAGHGVRFATVWQSLAQLHDRYGIAGDGVLANSTAKIFMGPVTDERTRSYLQGLVGDETVEVRSQTRAATFDPSRATQTRSSTQRPALTSPELQQLGPERALIIDGARKPALVATRPWWRERGW